MKPKKSTVDYSALLETLKGSIEILESNHALIESIREPKYKKSLRILKNCVGTFHIEVSVIGKNVPKNILGTLQVCQEVCQESAIELRKMDAGIFKDSAKVVEHCGSTVKKVIKKLEQQ